MATKLCIKNICGHVSTITAEADGMETLITIDTTCEKIKNWGTSFVFPMEYMNSPQNETFEVNNQNGKLTPTCFIPTVIINAVWLENGMMSKNLAKQEGIAKVEYVD